MKAQKLQKLSTHSGENQSWGPGWAARNAAASVSRWSKKSRGEFLKHLEVWEKQYIVL